MLDMDLLAREMAAIVDEAVERATQPLVQRIAMLETRGEPWTADTLKAAAVAAIAEIPVPEALKSVTVDDVRPIIVAAVAEAVDALPAPEPGKSVDPADVEAMVQRAVAVLPQPENGTSVTVDDVRPLIANEVERAVAALPPAEAGAPADPEVTRQMVDDAVAALPPAEPGKSITVADVEPVIANMVDRAVAALPTPKDGVGLAGALIDRAGDLIVTLTDGSTRSLGQVVGRDYDPAVLESAVVDAVAALPPPEPGEPGKSVDPAVVKQMVDDAVAHIPAPYTGEARGLYDPEAAYRALDAVSFNGCEWRAKVDNPGALPGPDWMLSAQRGKPGKAFDPKQLPAPIDIIAGYLSDDGLAIVLTKDNGDEVKIDLYDLATKIRSA